jgi:hypothetical protein
MPDFVDVSSGVEAAPGQKSVELMRAFIAAAQSAPADPGARQPFSSAAS